MKIELFYSLFYSCLADGVEVELTMHIYFTSSGNTFFNSDNLKHFSQILLKIELTFTSGLKGGWWYGGIFGA